LVFLGVATWISLAYAKSFKVPEPEPEPSSNGAALVSNSFTSQEDAAAFRRGAQYSCERSELETGRYSSTLEAICVASSIGEGEREIGGEETCHHSGGLDS